MTVSVPELSETQTHMLAAIADNPGVWRYGGNARKTIRSLAARGLVNYGATTHLPSLTLNGQHVIAPYLAARNEARKTADQKRAEQDATAQDLIGELAAHGGTFQHVGGRWLRISLDDARRMVERMDIMAMDEDAYEEG